MKMKHFLTFIFCFAFVNTWAQNVGIGTNIPQRSVHINSGTLLVTGDTGTAPTLGAGAKFLWVPAKSALRAGYTTSSGNWNHANIGQYSFAFGNQSNAPGTYGFAGGSTAFANGDNSIALGTTVNANADNSVAIGRNLTANAYGSFIVGQYNETTGGNNTTWVETDPLLVVGNGYLTNVGGFPIITRRDAFKIFKNGNTILGGSITGDNGRLEVGGTEVQLPQQAYSVQTGSTLNLIPLGVVLFAARSIGTSITIEEQQQFPSNFLSNYYALSPTDERLDITFEFNNALLTGYSKIFAEIAFSDNWGFNSDIKNINTQFTNDAASGNESELLIVPVVPGNTHRLRSMARWNGGGTKQLIGSLRLYGIK